MKITTKGRYSLRLMLDLAINQENDFISLRDNSKRQGVSVKYLEIIVGVLTRSGFLVSARGKNGGYRLAHPASEYTIGSILKQTEGSLAPVGCLSDDGLSCPRADDCLTLPLWRNLDHLIDGYLESVTLQDLLDKNVAPHDV